jgi:hypothetical protein
MTAIEDAMKKAGMKTGESELYVAACDALRLHGGNAAKAATKFARMLRGRTDLLELLAREYLARVALDMTSTKGDEATAQAAEPQKAHPKKSTGKVKVSGYDVQPYQRRTPEQRAAETAAWLTSADAVFETRRINDTALGDLRWRELRALVHENALNAASYLRLGTEATEIAILLDKIDSYAVVSEEEKKVRDIVPAKVLVQFIDEARVEAPQLVEAGMRLYAKHVEQRRVDTHG